MNVIVLSDKFEVSRKLKNKLVLLNKEFSSIACHTKETILENKLAIKKVNYIFSTWNMPVFNESEIEEYFPSLKGIFYAAGTVKYFATPFLNKGVRIFSAALANAIPVAEFVVAQIILANKGYFQAQRIYKKPFWKISFNKGRNYTLQKTGNYKTKLGLIGCGSIGSTIVKLLKPYHIDIAVYDPFLTKERIAELGVEHVDLEQLFKECDVISNHLPDIPQTKGLINNQLLSLMKETATFINTGRGEQVDESALARVMQKKPNATALLDVTCKEPLRPWSPLLRRKNIFVTPHIAGSVSNEIDRMVSYMYSSYRNFVEGKYDPHEVLGSSIQKQT